MGNALGDLEGEGPVEGAPELEGLLVNAEQHMLLLPLLQLLLLSSFFVFWLTQAALGVGRQRRRFRPASDE